MTDQTEAALAADGLTLATLYLCTIAYTDDITKIRGLVPATPPLGSGGAWTLLWGPVQSQNEGDANLVFVAGYYKGNALNSLCVTIRGTDIDIGIWGILKQIYEDLDATSQVLFPPRPGNPARVAAGTIDGLMSIQELASGTGPIKQTLLHFLQSTYSGSTNVRAIVTGHSLGGCLVNVVAPWMQSNLPSGVVIQPVTFAAPTAGNQAFANNFDKFSLARRFQNSLDTVPCAFESLSSIPSIYSSNSLNAPQDVKDGIALWEAALIGAGTNDYVQPTRGAQYLTGVFDSAYKKDWICQAWQQHHPSTYLALLTGQTPPTLPCPADR